jgi:hypothetical protein
MPAITKPKTFGFNRKTSVVIPKNKMPRPDSSRLFRVNELLPSLNRQRH